MGGGSGDAMVLGKQGPIALAIGAGGGCCLDIFTLLFLLSPVFPLSWRRSDID